MTPVSKKAKALVLWNESQLWGLLAVKSLEDAGLQFEIVRSHELIEHHPEEIELLFVPGGWASNKIQSIQESGATYIRDFVRLGGSYIGICGGAGLALEAENGLGLLPVSRVPRAQRVPSFAGPVAITLTKPNHPIWRDIPMNDPPQSTGQTLETYAWWPSQFSVNEPEAVEIIAGYHKPLFGSTTSDLCIQDIEEHAIAWAALEEHYGIFLDPKRLANQPAVLAGHYGRGRVVLSMVHFDTPGDPMGRKVLQNLWRIHTGYEPVYAGRPQSSTSSKSLHRPAQILHQAARDLIRLGQRLFLWRFRSDFLLHWRRGVRGLEFCTLFVITREIADLCAEQTKWAQSVCAELEETVEWMRVFSHKSKELLTREALLMQQERINFRHCNDVRVVSLREELFSNQKSHGGLFKRLLDRLDAILFVLLRNRTNPKP